MSGAPKPYRTAASGLLLSVRVTPNAGANAIEGVEVRDDGAAVLRLRVAAVPDRGRANAAVVAVLAKALGLPKSALAITAGETARIKRVALTGDPLALAAAIDALSA